MARMVLQVFKVIAISMVLVFVLDIAFYLYRAYNLNQRVQSVCVSLQKVVSENNYLPDGEYGMFMSIFNNIGSSMNRGDTFIVAHDKQFVRINYKQGVKNIDLPKIDGNKYIYGTDRYEKVNLVRDDLAVPADYGDIRPIEVVVEIVQPMWDFVGGLNADNWQKSDEASSPRTEFTYSYLVPCLKYQSVTN